MGLTSLNILLSRFMVHAKKILGVSLAMLYNMTCEVQSYILILNHAYCVSFDDRRFS